MPENLVAGSTGQPIQLSDIKEHLAIDFDEDDSRILNLVESAADYIEQQTSLALMPQTWEEVMPCFPYYSKAIELPRAPLSSVTSVTYYDASNVSTVWSSTNYYTQTAYKVPGKIYSKSSFPATYDRPDAVTIRYVAGYSLQNAPKKALQVLRLLVGHWNENREGTKEVPVEIQRMISELGTGSYY